MKITKYFILVFLLLSVISCTTPTESTTPAIEVDAMTNSLKVTNKSDREIYLFVVERDAASVINWTPQFSDPALKSNSSIVIEFSEIFNASTESVKSGDEIIVNYWDKTDTTNPKIFNKVVKL
jgi:hypothetical protein